VRGPLLGVDFGSAARLAPGESLAGPPAGSVPYLAPEVVAGRPAGRPADLWSAGCILFAALVGQLAEWALEREEKGRAQALAALPLDAAEEAALGVRYAPLHDLLARSDYAVV
jgi:serine/threonine protein kinase